MKYETRILKVGVMREGLALYDELQTTVEIEDEGGGEFVVLSQTPSGVKEDQKISIDVSEWPTLRKAIDDMVKRCKK
jgi:hypothetical protein